MECPTSIQGSKYVHLFPLLSAGSDEVQLGLEWLALQTAALLPTPQAPSTKSLTLSAT